MSQPRKLPDELKDHFVMVRLTAKDLHELKAWAAAEERSCTAQARLILRQALRARGKLPVPTKS